MEYIVDKEFEDVRLDKFLRKKYENIPLTEIFKGIRTGKIKVNGKKSKENYRLQLNDKIKVFFKDGETKEEKLLEIEDREIEKIKTEREKVRCPYCGHPVNALRGKDACCKGVFFKCKNKDCRKEFELKI